MRFEWDENKRLGNIAKHGIDFFTATQVFDGRPRLDYGSAHASELRPLSIAPLEGRFVVVWTWRGEELVRIISVRRARVEEERQYGHLYE